MVTGPGLWKALASVPGKDVGKERPRSRAAHQALEVSVLTEVRALHSFLNAVNLKGFIMIGERGFFFKCKI